MMTKEAYDGCIGAIFGNNCKPSLLGGCYALTCTRGEDDFNKTTHNGSDHIKVNLGMIAAYIAHNKEERCAEGSR